MELLEQPFVCANLNQWHHRVVTERCVRIGAQLREHIGVDLASHKRRHHFSSSFGVTRYVGEIGKARPLGGHVQTTVVGEAGK